MITSIQQVRHENIDWVQVRRRLQEYIKLEELTLSGLSDKMEVKESFLHLFIYSNKIQRKSVNFIWQLTSVLSISLNWLLNGIGSHDSEDPPGLQPETIIVEKGSGIRRNQTRLNAETGSFTDDVLEFVLAVDKYKKINKISFPTLTQIYELFLALGYRKFVNPIISPKNSENYLPNSLLNHED